MQFLKASINQIYYIFKSTLMKKILLLNPPRTKNYIRDYYCSKTSKSGYSYTPVDFF